MTSGSSRFFTHHVSDDGARYIPGEIVHVDHSSGRVQLVKDLEGGYRGHDLPGEPRSTATTPRCSGLTSEHADVRPWG